MTAEKRLQTKIIGWLKERGAVVIKLTAMPGVPIGIPDVLFLTRGGGWGFLEVKASRTAHFQPLQHYWLDLLNDMYYAKVVYPENWAEIRAELETMV